MESSRLENNLKIKSNCKPTTIKSKYKLFLSTTSKCLLTSSRNSNSVTSLRNMFQCLTILLVMNFFLICSLNFSQLRLRLFPFVLSLVTWKKGLASLQPPKYPQPFSHPLIRSPCHRRRPGWLSRTCLS